MIQKRWAGLGGFALFAWVATVAGQTYPTPPPGAPRAAAGRLAEPLFLAAPAEVAATPPLRAPSLGLPTQDPGVAAPAPAAPPPSAAARPAAVLLAPASGLSPEPLPQPAEDSPVSLLGPGVTYADLIRLEERDAELRQQIVELSKKYESLNVQLRRRELAEEKQKDKEARQRRPQGPFPSTEPKYEKVYRIGLFWWRDNTKEAEGRGPYRPDMEPVEHRIAENVHFGDGLRWSSDDGYFKLIFHNLTQLDMRQPFPEGDPLHGGFVIPRQRWYFNGTIGDYVDFVTSVNRGYSSLDVLDSFADFVVNREWLMFRVGRFKMPSQYEYVEIAEGDLLGPERSLFVQNFAANRQLGAMAEGFLFERRFRYYAAVGSGPRRSFGDFNSSRDYFFYLDYRPFITNTDSFLRYLHLVSTVDFGSERNPLSPFAVQTMNQTSSAANAAIVSPTIMEFRTDVFENGPRFHWGFEPVYFYKNFGLLGSVQGGYQDYSRGNLAGVPGLQQTAGEFIGVNSPTRTHVPMFGWSLGGWYFLTGEEITRRRFLVEPKRPFGYYNGTLNPGAVELFARFSNLQLGSQVFAANLVDQNLWTNRVSATDIGFNWYLNHFIKFTFDWQHVMPGSPVALDPSAGTKTAHYDLLLFRTQVYF